MRVEDCGRIHGAGQAWQRCSRGGARRTCWKPWFTVSLVIENMGNSGSSHR